MNIEEALKKYKVNDLVNTKHGIGKIINYEIVDNTNEKRIYWFVFISKIKGHVICSINDFIDSETQKEDTVSNANKIFNEEILEKKIKDYLKHNLTVKLERQLPPKYSNSYRKYLVAKLYLENELISTSNTIEFDCGNFV